MTSRHDPRRSNPPPDAGTPGHEDPAPYPTGLENQLDSPKANPRDGKGVKDDPLVRRFWAKVDRRGERDCWPWLAGTNGRYGKLSVPTGRRPSKPVYAHRLAYELTFGPIPPGQVVHHICRVTLCCNPTHLRVGSQAENVMRDTSPPALNAHKTHCIHGHRFTPDNTRIYTRRTGEVERVCVTCERERNRARRTKATAA
jgi:hypothetical protein